MGYGTNATTIPSLMGKGSLIISDSLNHTSIVNGVRAAGSTCKVFKHDDPIHLEQVLRKAIVEGQPRKNRPWRKILVICEGVYSMEGEISHLKEIVQVCKKYKAYDEGFSPSSTFFGSDIDVISDMITIRCNLYFSYESLFALIFIFLFLFYTITS